MLSCIHFIIAFIKELLFNAFNFRNEFNCNTKLDRKVVVITGGNSGIGKVTARELARRGANVIIGCRDVEKGQKVIEEIQQQHSNANIRLIKLDLSSLKSVRHFAKQVCKEESKIDILINNAGVAMSPKRKTEDGFELHFGTNHLSHFLLIHLLLDRLKSASNARIVNVASQLYMLGEIHFDDINLDHNYTPIKGYTQSKLANVLFSGELGRRLSHTNINVYCVHPGLVNNNKLISTGKCSMKSDSYFMKLFWSIFSIDTYLGSQSTLYCALDQNLYDESGYYYNNCMREKLLTKATDRVSAIKLWQISSDFVKLDDRLKI